MIGSAAGRINACVFVRQAWGHEVSCSVKFTKGISGESSQKRNLGQLVGIPETLCGWLRTGVCEGVHMTLRCYQMGLIKAESKAHMREVPIV